MNIIIPENGRSEPFIKCKTHGTKDNWAKSYLSFVLDVTNWKKGGEGNKVPLIKFTTAGDNVALMEGKLKNKYITLKIVAQGEDSKVTERRNARLEWNSTDLTLYYVQDKPSDGFKVIVR